MRLVLISDTHGYHDRLEVPEGDVLVHAGDLSKHGRLTELAEFDAWLGKLPHTHKIVIAGNHDFAFERDPKSARHWMRHCTYLQDSGVTIDGVTFWGSPWQPWFFDWAFNLPRGKDLAKVWAKIPTGTDVLITHGPPAGIRDKNTGGEAVGCVDLLERVQAVRPRLHVFGHIHESAGVEEIDGTTFVNAACMNRLARPTGTAAEAGPYLVDL